MSLLGLQSKWIELFDEMRKGNDPWRLAAPFLSVRREPDANAQSRPILLVGKATRGTWKLDQFLSNSNSPLCERVTERLDATREHLKWMEEERRPSAFWRFWKALRGIGPPVIWTNQAKIGVKIGNPHGQCYSIQAGLACETLKAEICDYRPSIVVIAGELATNEIIYRVFGARPLWNEPTEELCWIDQSLSKPAVLWVDHPERKAKKRVDFWLTKAEELVRQSF